jgi:hypothetical protein
MRALLALALAAGCAHAPARPPIPPEIRSAANAGVAVPALADLLARHWDATLRTNPVFATSVGDHRFDADVLDESEAARAPGGPARRRGPDSARRAAASPAPPASTACS